MDSVLQKAIERIIRVADPDRIILFGSRARNEHDPNSDFDLLVIKMGVASSLAQADVGMGNHSILLEDRCFCVQQAVEKAVKCLCIYEGILFPRTHNIGFLLDLLVDNDVALPQDADRARN